MSDIYWNIKHSVTFTANATQAIHINLDDKGYMLITVHHRWKLKRWCYYIKAQLHSKLSWQLELGMKPRKFQTIYYVMASVCHQYSCLLQVFHIQIHIPYTQLPIAQSWNCHLLHTILSIVVLWKNSILMSPQTGCSSWKSTCLCHLLIPWKDEL